MKKKFIDKKPFFIAELSGNHGGKLSVAKKIIKKAKKGGADAVKLQTYSPETMTLNNNYKIKTGLWKNYDLWKLYEKAHTPYKWHKILFNYAKKHKIKIFSTPFSVSDLNFLEKLNCSIYKVASFEITDLNLIKKIAMTKKPMIISTGLASIKEVNRAFLTAKKNGCKDITLLYCVSNYPSNTSDFNLEYIKFLKKKFKCRVGISDHSIGDTIPKLAVAYGAEVVEKHIALKNFKTVDYKFSLKENEIKNFSDGLKNVYKITTNKDFKRSKSEMKNIFLRRSIYALKNIKKGETFNEKNIASLRPNLGLCASNYLNILGKKSPINIKKYDVLSKNFKI